MDIPANPVLLLPAGSGSWWKKSMTLTQMGLAVAVAAVFVGGGAGVAQVIAKRRAPAVVKTPVMAAQSEVELTLALTGPSVIIKTSDKMFKLTGVTRPNVSVVIFSQSHNSSGRSDEYGNFEIEIEMEEGANSLTIVVLSSDGQEKTVTEEVVYESSN